MTLFNDLVEASKELVGDTAPSLAIKTRTHFFWETFQMPYESTKGFVQEEGGPVSLSAHSRDRKAI
jgi:hypothetical protein